MSDLPPGLQAQSIIKYSGFQLSTLNFIEEYLVLKIYAVKKKKDLLPVTSSWCPNYV